MAAQTARAAATTAPTKANRSVAWTRYLSFLRSIELQHDPFLDQLPPHDCHHIIGAFGHAIGIQVTDEISPQPDKPVKSGSAFTAALDAVSAAFWDHQRQDPYRDQHNKRHPFLERQIRGYTNQHPAPVQQKALPPASILRLLLKQTSTPCNIAVGQLASGALFFAHALL